jgi:uncharacterized linocin/CFP29 family protein
MSTATLAKPGAVQLLTNNGRDRFHWGQDVWDRIDKAVHDEVMRTRVGAKFLPLQPVLPRTTSVPSDRIQPNTLAPNVLLVDEGQTSRLNEYWVEFSLTPQQVDYETGDVNESGQSTAVTLATRAANILSQAEDEVIFQGRNVIFNPPTNSAWARGHVQHRGDPEDTGLLNLPVWGQIQPPLQQPVLGIDVLPSPLALVGAAAPLPRYADQTVNAAHQAIGRLQAQGHYGPYALVLQTTAYADAHATLPNTLVMPAEKIKPLMAAGLFGTGALPSNPAGGLPPMYFGVLVSVGGNTVDLVVGLDATTAFMQQDPGGNYRFRVLERFALRLKNTEGIVRLQFQ